jgi:hypothetical protein
MFTHVNHIGTDDIAQYPYVVETIFIKDTTPIPVIDFCTVRTSKIYICSVSMFYIMLFLWSPLWEH